MAGRKRIRAADIVIVAVSLAAVGVSVLLAASGSAGAARLLVQAPSGEYVYPLDKDARIEARGPLGVTVVLISGGSARIVDSPCENKLCIAMGAVSASGQWASCLPNRVFIRVSGGSKKGEVDAGAF